MSPFLQLLGWLGRPSGALFYHLGLCALVAGTAGLAARAARPARRDGAPGEAQAWEALAVVLLLLGALRVMALLLSSSPWAPPAERAATTLTLGVMLLALAAPLPRAIMVVVSGVMGTAVLLGLAASMVLWPAGALGAPFYSGAVPDLLWLLAQMGLLVAGVVALSLQHRPGWRVWVCCGPRPGRDELGGGGRLRGCGKSA